MWRSPGRVNVLNLLAASAAALARGLSLAQIAEAAPMLRAVPGRFEAVDAGQPFTVVVRLRAYGMTLCAMCWRLHVTWFPKRTVEC